MARDTHICTLMGTSAQLYIGIGTCDRLYIGIGTCDRLYIGIGTCDRLACKLYLLWELVNFTSCSEFARIKSL